MAFFLGVSFGRDAISEVPRSIISTFDESLLFLLFLKPLFQDIFVKYFLPTTSWLGEALLNSLKWHSIYVKRNFSCISAFTSHILDFSVGPYLNGRLVGINNSVIKRALFYSIENLSESIAQKVENHSSSCLKVRTWSLSRRLSTRYLKLYVWKR